MLFGKIKNWFHSRRFKLNDLEKSVCHLLLSDYTGKCADALVGTLIHGIIGNDFVNRSSTTLRDYNRGITTIINERGGSLPRRRRSVLFGQLRPDLIDYGIDRLTGNIVNLGFIFEIKPVSQRQLGEAEVLMYLGLLNGFDPGWRLGTASDYTYSSASFTVLAGLCRVRVFPPHNGVIAYESSLNRNALSPNPVLISALAAATMMAMIGTMITTMGAIRRYA